MRPIDPFDKLLHQYRGMLYSICRKLSRRDAAVEDLLQEASLALWQNRDKLMEIPAGPKQAVWVWRTARNAAIDVLRRTSPTEPLPENVEEVAVGTHVDSVHDFNRQSLINELYEQIELLTEPDQTIVKMQLQGYSYEEIGEALDMTVKNVSVRLVRVKEKLRLSMVKN